MPSTTDSSSPGCDATGAPDGPRIRLGSPAALLAAVPHLLGFMPATSLVVIGTEPPAGQVKVTLRYELPDPPGDLAIKDIVAHALGVLTSQLADDVVVIGYGPDHLVTPLANQFRMDAAVSGLTLPEILRAQDGRYWSYLCATPGCCPPEGTPFDPAADPAWAMMTETGNQVFRTRDELAASIAALDGDAGEAARGATQWAERKASALITRVTTSTGKRTRTRRLIAAAGISAVAEALATYRRGGQVTSTDHLAWLTVVLRDLRVRDDAWARLDPAHRVPHCRMWADLTRAARPGYVAAPASLLAFTAWQCGNGALANVALDRALADQPAYSMAELLRQVVDGGIPPSAARLPMSPEDVAATYDEIDDDCSFGSEPGEQASEAGDPAGEPDRDGDSRDQAPA